MTANATPPPAGRSTAPQVRDRGTLALTLVAAALALVAVGFVVSLVVDSRLPVAFFASGALAVPVAGAGLVLGVRAAAAARGRGRGLVAAVASLPVIALGVVLTLSLVAVLDGSL